jgi:lipoprotein-anchoring transpeptidase ErfK/SrfK
MICFPLRALCGTALMAGLAACVPTTTTSTSGSTRALAAPAKIEGIYLASSDNGFAVPAVPTEKVPDEFERQVVDFDTAEVPGTIIINPSDKHLFLVLGKGKAIRYGIAVGKAGFEWSGVANVTNRKPWPTWTPPPEMIDRKPELAKWEKGQPGGPTNPLGARALYLTTNGRDYGYRIHGTPDWWSIGKNASSGCIRMINQDVMDLYGRVPDGAKVIVLTRDGKMPTGLKLPPPAPKKAKPAAAVTPEVAPALATEANAATPVTPVAAVPPPGVTAADGPMSTPLPGSGLLPAPAAAPQPATPEAATPDATTSTAPTAVAAPVAPATAAPTADTPPAAMAACAVPLVNGACPQG